MPAETESLDFAVAATTLEIIFIRRKRQFIVDFTLFAFKILHSILVGGALGIPISNEFDRSYCVIVLELAVPMISIFCEEV